MFVSLYRRQDQIKSIHIFNFDSLIRSIPQFPVHLHSQPHATKRDKWVFGFEGGKQESLNPVALPGEFAWSPISRFNQVVNYILLSILLGSFFLIKIKHYWDQVPLFYFNSDLVIELATRQRSGCACGISQVNWTVTDR